ncbi:unnamed protein product [marine sediment metagenome]|uniref:Uncharacterized protein n=1 Tax=marine sediment metagenome TaxID=412755 RepID=X0SAS4_9ZZZZ
MINVLNSIFGYWSTHNTPSGINWMLGSIAFFGSVGIATFIVTAIEMLWEYYV